MNLAKRRLIDPYAYEERMNKKNIKSQDINSFYIKL